MKILHYSLGFPPYRTGGLTKYCTDLMLSQLEEGHQIGLIWPGEIIPWVRQRIKQHPDCFGLKSYEIINPLPVALDEGIVQPEQYMKDGDTKVFEQLFMEIKPNVLHIHTLMGLPPAMLKAAKACNVRTVFTTHDYYGICPKVTLFHNGQLCDDDHNCADCVCCNQNGLSMRKIAILQSRAYRQLKNSAVVKTLRRKHRTQFFEENSVSPTAVSVSSEKATQYIELRRFYLEMLSEIDIIHFNSTVARDVYLRYFTPRDYRVISITHRDIHDNRKAKNFDCDKLRITYLAPAKVFKGYALLKSVLDYMWDDGEQDFELRLFNIVSDPSPYMIMQDGYKYSELAGIFENTDVLVAPSIWYETYGFTVLEALSYGVPVIVSNRVGAKDIIGEEVTIAPEEQLLKSTISAMLNRENLRKRNYDIVHNMKLPMIKEMVQKLEKEIYHEYT